MSTGIPRPLRRLVHPRSRRSQLWACVYCGTFDRDDGAAADDLKEQRAAD